MNGFLIISISWAQFLPTYVALESQNEDNELYLFFITFSIPARQSHPLLNSFGWVYNQPTTSLFTLLVGTAKHASKTEHILSKN